MYPYQRNCPKCNKEVFYKRKYSLKRAEKEHRLCNSCCLIGNNHTKDICPPNKGKISKKIEKSIINGNIWIKNNNWYRKCPSCKKSIQCSSYDNAYRRINSVCHKCGLRKNIGKKSHNKGKHLPSETKYKLRLAAIERIKKQGIFRSYNPKACDFINNLNKEKGWNLQHALNGGEVELYGYFVDGYDKDRNIIFEYDEPTHHLSHYKQRDLQRQKEIIENIKPNSFIRYDERNDNLFFVKS